ncbi:WD40-repeat-containing domain protein [Mycena leptocephala]|nr:WD40-repeat-containing domain protein [Mycena leptocephala]
MEEAMEATEGGMVLTEKRIKVSDEDQANEDLDSDEEEYTITFDVPYKSATRELKLPCTTSFGGFLTALSRKMEVSVTHLSAIGYIPSYKPRNPKPVSKLLENAEDYESMMEDIEEYRKSCLKKKNGIVKKFSIALSDTSNTPEGSKSSTKKKDAQPAAPLEASERWEHELMAEIEKHHACQAHTGKACFATLVHRNLTSVEELPDQLKIEDKFNKQKRAKNAVMQTQANGFNLNGGGGPMWPQMPMPPMPWMYGMPPWMMQGPPGEYQAPAPATTAPTPSPPRKRKYPAIMDWLPELDADEDRGADGLDYQQYANIFSSIGIIHLDDLLEVESAEKLQKLTKINWGTAKRLMKFAREDRQKLKKPQNGTNAEDIEALSDRNRNLLSVLRSVTRAETLPKEVTEHIEKLGSTLASLSDEVQERRSRPFFKRMLNYGEDAHTLAGQIKKIASAIEAFNVRIIITYSYSFPVDSGSSQLAATVRIEAVGDNIQAGVQSVLETLRGSLPHAVKAAFDAEERELCWDTTRTGILSEISQWTNIDGAKLTAGGQSITGDPGHNDSCLFWMNGSAGTGQTTIAATVAHRYSSRTPSALGASFFCSRNDVDCSNLDLIFTTIAYQLAHFHPGFAMQISSIREANPDIGYAYPEHQLRTLIVEPLKAIRNSFPPCVIVLDALDECKDTASTSTILAALLNHVTNLFPLKFFITSRPEPHITRAMSSGQLGTHAQKFHLHEVELPVVQRDIQDYLLAKLSEIGGLFIFASTAVKFIAVLLTDGTASTTLINLLSDSGRFMRAFFAVISVSPLQVYHSALLFMPTATTLQNVYGSNMDLPVKAYNAALERWSPCLRTIDVDYAVAAIAFSPGGTHIVSGSEDKTIRTWDVITGTELQRLQGHSDCVGSVEFSSDGTYIVSGSDDKSVHLWDVIAGTKLQTMHGHSDTVRSVAFSPNGKHVVSGSTDRTVRIWDVITGTKLRTMRGHSDTVYCMGFSPDGIHIVSGSEDKTVRIWNAATSTHQKLQGHSDTVCSVAFSPNGTCVASGSMDKIIRIWDAVTGTELHAMHGHSDAVRSAAFSPNGTYVVSGSKDKMVRIWNVITGTEFQTLQGHSDMVYCVRFSPDETHIVSGSKDKTVRIWDVVAGIDHQRLQGHSDMVCFVAFSPDGTRIASGSTDEIIRIWDAVTGTELQAMHGHSDTVHSVAFSPNGTYVGSVSKDKTVRIWGAITGVELRLLQGHSDSINSVVLCPDGTYLVSGSDDKTARIWDATNGNQLLQLKSSGVIASVAFSPDETRIVTEMCLIARVFHTKWSYGMLGVMTS